MMNFHPDKCNVLTITKKRKPIKHQYTLHGHILEQVTSAKYLGITITSDMKWNTHIANICKKANNTLGFLKRNLNISNPSLKEKAYKTLVRPTLEYACSTWDPYQQNNINKLEGVQKRAARYVRNNYNYNSATSVSNIVKDLNWAVLQDRRKNTRLCLFYKIVNNKVKIDPSDKLIPTGRASRAHNGNSFRQQQCSTNIRRDSFYPRTIRDWNALPSSTVSAVSLESFKTHLAA
jgi:hypothetical protein